MRRFWKIFVRADFIHFSSSLIKNCKKCEGGATDFERLPFRCRRYGLVSLYANQFLENFLGGQKLSPYLCTVKTKQRLTKQDY